MTVCLGHLGHRKVISVLKKRFTSSDMSGDVERYVLSFDLCQCANKQGHRKVPMVERRVTTEPFETVAIDIVGLLS